MKKYPEILDTLVSMLPTVGTSKEDLRLFTGKNGVRYFAHTYYKGDYTWRQLRDLFRQGIVTGSYGSYSMKII